MGSENEVTGMVLRRGPMTYGRPNVIIGGIAIFVAAAGGMVLGFTMDAYFPQGFYALPLTRVLMKAGHTHGMPFALYNLIYGSLIDRLTLDGKWKKRGSLLAMLAFIMPVGLFLRGAAGGTMALAPVVMVGALCFLASAAVLIRGAVNMKRE
jgi:MFS family permease